MRGLRCGRGAVVALFALAALGTVSRSDDAPAPGRGAWIGVSTRGLSDDWRERENYWARGVMVVEVARGSAADQAGMGPGDVLVSIDSHTLQNPTDLTEAEAAMEPGRLVPVVLAREGGRMIKIFNLEPGRAPGDAPTPAVAVEANAAVTPETADETTPDAVVLPPSAPAETRLRGSAELGVRCENLSFDLAEALGALEGQGVLVLAVHSGSPADNAGIRPGDVISWVGGKPVVDVERLEGAIAGAASPVAIVTRRGGTTREVAAEFEAPVAAGAVEQVATGDAGQADAVAALRNEVRSLHDEVLKLRAELTALARATAARQP